MERYFYTTSTFKLGDKVFKPCVSYETSSLKEEQVLKLLEEKRITLSESYVFFINGKPATKKQVEKRDEVKVFTAKGTRQKQHKKEEKQQEFFPETIDN